MGAVKRETEFYAKVELGMVVVEEREWVYVTHSGRDLEWSASLT